MLRFVAAALVALDAEQEIALGAQAAPQLAARYGGLEPEPGAQALLDQVGQRIGSGTAAAGTPYRFDLHVLDDDEALNAFALPGALAVRLIRGAGNDPAGLVEALEVPARSSSGMPESFSTHPAPGNRAARLRTAIEEGGDAL